MHLKASVEGRVVLKSREVTLRNIAALDFLDLGLKFSAVSGD